MVLRVAYLINQYPKVSHSFVRREILALERQGVEVVRLALRGWDGDLVDDEDLRERQRTFYVLQGGMARLATALVRTMVVAPQRFLKALRQTLSLARRADRPWPYHFVYLAEACLIKRRLRGTGVQHLHAHFGTNPAEIALLVRALGGPSYSFTVHGPEEFDRPARLKLREKMRDAAFTVAISSFGRSQLYRWADAADWHKIKVVHCGLEPAFHSGAASVPTATARLVCVGRLCEQKGQLLLVDAVERLVRSGVPIELVLAGDGEMRAEIEGRIARSGLQRRVRITGWIGSNEVRAEILAARALVLPSFAEGLPVVLMEAMALGRPVVTTFVAGIPELVRNGESGWLVPAGDVEGLTEALRQCLAATPSELAQMGERARARVLQRHSIDVEAGKLAALFREPPRLESAPSCLA